MEKDRDGWGDRNYYVVFKAVLTTLVKILVQQRELCCQFKEEFRNTVNGCQINKYFAVLAACLDEYSMGKHACILEMY